MQLFSKVQVSFILSTGAYSLSGNIDIKQIIMCVLRVVTWQRRGAII